MVGASDRPGSRGAELLGNLRSIGYPGTLYPVNPSRDRVADLTCWPSLAALPEPPEMVAIGVSSERCLDVVREAVDVGAKAIGIVAAGFAEAGPEGAELQDAIVELCLTHDMALTGPNCLGVWSRLDHVAYWLAEGIDLPLSGLGFIVQSGALASSVMDPMTRRGVAFDVIATVGNEGVLATADYLATMADDPRIRAIAVIAEQIRKPDAFVDALAIAREADKPVFVLKLGRSEVGKRAALAHTASIAGEDAVARAVVRQFGATVVDDLDSIVEHLLLAQRHPRGLGRRILYVTVSGAGAGLVGDLVTAAGGEPAPLDVATRAALERELPGVHVGNPLDVAWAGDQPGVFERCIEVAASSDAIDAICVGLNVAHAVHPDGTRFYLEQADAVGSVQAAGKPGVLFTLTGGSPDPVVLAAADSCGVPLLVGAGPAISAIVDASGLPRSGPPATDRVSHRDRPTGALPIGDGRILTDDKAIALLQTWGLTAAAASVVTTAEEAIDLAERIGMPVVLKGVGPGLLHKTDVGLVRLGVGSREEVRNAFASIMTTAAEHDIALDGVLVQAAVTDSHEMLLGIKRDEIFGSVLVLGWGGIFAEIFGETAIRRVPVDAAAARSMVAELRGTELLTGLRGQAASDVSALEDAILRLSDFADAGRDVLDAVDLNPTMVLAEGRGVVVVDALIHTVNTRA